MDPTQRPSAGLRFGLSARLLALTVLFVMLSEVLIYVPSISRFRKEYLEDRMATAHLAVLASQASPEAAVSEPLLMDLLLHAEAYAIILNTPDRRMLMLKEEMPPAVDASFDLDDRSPLRWIPEAFAALIQPDNRVIRIVGRAPRRPEATIEVLLDETPMREAMYGYSWRILTLSVIISLITAGLVYLSLQWLMVRRILRICDTIMRFRENPEDEGATIEPSSRRDELGIAERELAAMQTDLRAALRQKTHLAALGAAVAKINHDLRNTLATAALASDRLADSPDPLVKRIAPRLYEAIDRAVALCGQTLEFARDVRRSLRPSAAALRDLVAELDGIVAEQDPETRPETGWGPEPADGADRRWRVDVVGGETTVVADRRQMFRVFSNLALNAHQAGARTLRIAGRRRDDAVVIDVSDDGPGIPEAARAKLFQPFASASRDGGMGLGLVIARDIVTAHGGELTLADTGPHGTTFRIILPTRPHSGRRDAREPVVANG